MLLLMLLFLLLPLLLLLMWVLLHLARRRLGVQLVAMSFLGY